MYVYGIYTIKYFTNYLILILNSTDRFVVKRITRWKYFFSNIHYEEGG